MYRSDQLNLRHRDVYRHVARVRSQWGRKTVVIPIRLVCRRLAHADTDRAHDPHAAYPVHAKPGCYPGDYADRQRHGDWHLLAVLTPWRPGGHVPSSAAIFPMARRDPAQLLPAHAAGQTLVHPA